MAKPKDKFRCWRSTYSISANDYFRSELTLHEYAILVSLFRAYKFQGFINDENFDLLRVKYKGFTLTCQRYITGDYCIKFNINKSWREKI